MNCKQFCIVIERITEKEESSVIHRTLLLFFRVKISLEGNEHELLLNFTLSLPSYFSPCGLKNNLKMLMIPVVRE